VTHAASVQVVPQASLSRYRKLAIRLSAVYLAVVIAAIVSMQWADDAWVPTLIEFGPRWILAVPLLLLIPLALRAESRRAGIILGLTVLFIAGPACGGVVSVKPFVNSSTSLVRVRIASWNADATRSTPSIINYLETLKPDVLLIQESGGVGIDDPIPGLEHHADGPDGLQILSKYPVSLVSSLNQDDLAGWAGAARFKVASPMGDIPIVNVHLPTIRYGLEDSIATKFRNVAKLREAIAKRSLSSQRVLDWIGGQEPGLIIGGDFNMPVESAIFRRDWKRFGNAYLDAGFGWGTTKQTRWHGVRIDHILYTEPWTCREVWVGESLGSDHRMLVADLEIEDRWQ